MRGQAKTTTWPGGVAGQQVRLSHILLQPGGEGEGRGHTGQHSHRIPPALGPEPTGTHSSSSSRVPPGGTSSVRAGITLPRLQAPLSSARDGAPPGGVLNNGGDFVCCRNWGSHPAFGGQVPGMSGRYPVRCRMIMNCVVFCKTFR